jgi:hypothetical protein
MLDFDPFNFPPLVMLGLMVVAFLLALFLVLVYWLIAGA